VARGGAYGRGWSPRISAMTASALASSEALRAVSSSKSKLSCSEWGSGALPVTTLIGGITSICPADLRKESAGFAQVALDAP
jgi:hypothetical protein